jgi:hypothetical protein
MDKDRHAEVAKSLGMLHLNGMMGVAAMNPMNLFQPVPAEAFFSARHQFPFQFPPNCAPPSLAPPFDPWTRLGMLQSMQQQLQRFPILQTLLAAHNHQQGRAENAGGEDKGNVDHKLFGRSTPPVATSSPEPNGTTSSLDELNDDGEDEREAKRIKMRRYREKVTSFARHSSKKKISNLHSFISRVIAS